MISTLEKDEFKKNQHIDSVKYKDKIDSLVKEFQLTRKTGITNFCICFSFKAGRKYFLSNMADWAIEYHEMGGTRSDEVFDLDRMSGRDFFLPRSVTYDLLQKLLVRKEEKYGYYDTYSLIRRCVDCTFVLLSLHNYQVEDKKNFYLNTKTIFEEFCAFFIQGMVKEILTKNKGERNLRIFNDNVYLTKIIKKELIFTKSKLSGQEQQCLILLKYGYPIKLIARNLCLKESTVRKYFETIKEKLNVGTTLELIDIITMEDL